MIVYQKVLNDLISSNIVNVLHTFLKIKGCLSIEILPFEHIASTCIHYNIFSGLHYSILMKFKP